MIKSMSDGDKQKIYVAKIIFELPVYVLIIE